MLDSPNPCGRVHDPASWSYDSLQSLPFRALRPPSWECEKAKIILCSFSLKLEFLFSSLLPKTSRPLCSFVSAPQNSVAPDEGWGSLWGAHSAAEAVTEAVKIAGCCT